jgi:hypothetical protein
MQQMAQRVLQYGLDFAGMWMELASTLGGDLAARASSPRASGEAAGKSATAKTPEAGIHSSGSIDRARVVITIVSRRPATATVDLRLGQSEKLAVHALRTDGPGSIRNVQITRNVDGSISLTVKVSDKLPAGVYSAVIVDATSKAPRGTLSVHVQGRGR